MSGINYPKVDFLAEYANYMRMKKRAPRTIESYLISLKNIPAEVEAYFSSDIDANNIVPAYRSYLEFLYRKKRIITRAELEDLKDIIKKPRRNGNNARSERKFSVPQEEWGNCIRQIPKRVYKMGAWLGFNFGLRRGEICHLRVQDIDFQEEEILVRGQRKVKHQIKWNPKYNKSRQIPMTRQQAKTLKKWIASIPEWVKGPYLLWNVGKDKGAILPFKSFYRNVRKATFEGRKLHPHTLRYSFATHWYEKTKDIQWVSDLLGHASVGVTSTYLCLGQKELKAKAKKYMG